MYTDTLASNIYQHYSITMLSGATSNEDRLYMKSSSGHICHEGHLVFHSTVHEHVQKSGSRAPHINFDT